MNVADNQNELLKCNAKVGKEHGVAKCLNILLNNF